jgi:hypothetical protein
MRRSRIGRLVAMMAPFGAAACRETGRVDTVGGGRRTMAAGTVALTMRHAVTCVDQRRPTAAR